MTMSRVDPLGVLASTRRVVERARQVRIEPGGVVRLADDLAGRDASPPPWNRDLHWSDGAERMANYLLVLDALNFSFWGEPRWRVRYDGETLDGYWALAASLTRAMEAGVPLDDARYLTGIDREQLARILAGEHEIPLLDERARVLREVGRGLLDHWGGRFTATIAAADRRGTRLVEIVSADFPSFRDVARYGGVEVRFYKRAQILVGDLHGAFGGVGPGTFDDLAELTAFADYKVPQVLRERGVLVYAPALVERLGARRELPPGSPEEVEIRAATIWGVEELRRALAERGRSFDAYQLDWLLWDAGQRLGAGVLPYHRTRTIFY
ncbi:MAG TPA: queuosine salvage family protein [Thermomicrobiaceae bacterium]|nr:queuosine salvage family protein [Thermomicrobiaceae bacterium]